jgi:hypothetical protein
MDVPSSLQGRIFNKTTFCSTATTVPAIQVASLSTAAAGSYPYGSYHLHDFNIIQVGATATVPVVGINQMVQHGIVERIQIDQVGPASGLIWSNLWDNSGVRDSYIFTEQSTPTANTYGLWLYNNDPSETGAGQVFADRNFTSGFDRGTQIGVISSTSSISSLANDTIVGSVQAISGVSMVGNTSQQNNFEYVFAGGVNGLHLDVWYGESALTDGIVITNSAQFVEISNGWTNEGSLTGTHPADVFLDTGTAFAASPGPGLYVHNNHFSTVAVNGFYSPNASNTSGRIEFNKFEAKTSSGSTCFNMYNPTAFRESGDVCLTFGTFSTDVVSWVAWNPNVSGVYSPLVKGTVRSVGTAPTASVGTVATNSTNNIGELTGLSAATAITITFANSGFINSAFCVVTPGESLATPPYISAISKTAFTVTSVAITGTLFYQCSGN